jgi:hypothetical protein
MERVLLPPESQESDRKAPQAAPTEATISFQLVAIFEPLGGVKSQSIASEEM